MDNEPLTSAVYIYENRSVHCVYKWLLIDMNVIMNVSFD